MKKPNDTLHLVLTKKWYGMIETGEKREEYRRTRRLPTQEPSFDGQWRLNVPMQS
jgi:hypothetical protein